MTAEKQCNIELELTADGRGRVIVDGHDLSNRISKVELQAAASKATSLVLHINAVSVKVTGSAWVSHKLPVYDNAADSAIHDEGTP